MEPSGQSERAGIRLKRIRERLELTLRDVEASTRRLAKKKKNPDYIVSRGWLHNIEKGTYKPSLCKCYSLGAVYGVHWSTVFSFFGCNLRDFDGDRAMFPPPKTQLEDMEPVVVPVKSRQRLDKTNLLARLGKIWGDTPNRLVQHLDLRNGVYGFVGLSDRTMYPILRPGSIVQIDQDERKILPVEWENEHERPIYFLELRGEYICSWCEMNGGYLSSIPHPNSKCEVRRFSYPREAEIVGRVTGIAMRLVEAD